MARKCPCEFSPPQCRAMSTMIPKERQAYAWKDISDRTWGLRKGVLAIREGTSLLGVKYSRGGDTNRVCTP